MTKCQTHYIIIIEIPFSSIVMRNFHGYNNDLENLFARKKTGIVLAWQASVAKNFKTILNSIFEKSESNQAKGLTTTLSVNSLTKISEQVERMAQGQNLTRAAFTISFILSAWFIADLFSLLFEKYIPSAPVSPLSMRSRSMVMSSPMDYEIIYSRNLFSSKTEKPKGNEVDLESDPVPTNLPIQLIGTVIFQNPSRSLAALQDKSDNKVYPVRMNDEIAGKLQVLSVEARKVIFINLQSKRKEYVDIPDDSSMKISMNARPSTSSKSGGNNITQVEENKFVVKRAELDAQMANFNTLITQARAVPEMKGGQMVGFRLMQIQPGSFYEKIGLKLGDVITSVNGEKITDAAKALTILQELKHMNSLDLGTLRNGKEVNLNYDIQ
jgi:general secretion pathway protein C